MGCQHCGGRMLSKGALPGAALICSDCGSPLAQVEVPSRLSQRLSGLLLTSMLMFVLLLLFLTGKDGLVQDQPGLNRLEAVNSKQPGAARPE